MLTEIAEDFRRRHQYPAIEVFQGKLLSQKCDQGLHELLFLLSMCIVAIFRRTGDAGRFMRPAGAFAVNLLVRGRGVAKIRAWNETQCLIGPFIQQDMRAGNRSEILVRTAQNCPRGRRARRACRCAATR